MGSRFQDYLQNLSPRGFLLLQCLIAAPLSAGACACILFLRGAQTDGLNITGLAAALILCCGIPALLQKGTQRPMKRLNLMIVLWIVLFFAFYLAVFRPSFS